MSLADHFERFTDSSIHNLQQHKMLLEEMNTSLELQKSFSTPCILVILIKSIWLSLKTLEVLIPTKYFCFLRDILRAVGLLDSPTQQNLLLKVKGVFGGLSSSTSTTRKNLLYKRKVFVGGEVWTLMCREKHK